LKKQLITTETDNKKAKYANKDARIADEVGSITQVSQVGLHYSLHFLLSEVIERLQKCCGCQEHSTAACDTVTSAGYCSGFGG